MTPRDILAALREEPLGLPILLTLFFGLPALLWMVAG